MPDFALVLEDGHQLTNPHGQGEDTRVFLTNVGGCCLEYASLLALVFTLGELWIRHHLRAPEAQDSSAPCWRLVTKDGQELSSDEVMASPEVRFSLKRPLRFRLRMYAHYPGYGPVPGVSAHYGGRAHRRFQHMNERRLAVHFTEEGEVPPRASRSHNTIPNPWDDYPVTARDDRSWKRFRRTQFR